MKPAWDQVVPYLDRVEEEAFTSEGGTTRGGRWPRLSERYRRWKARNFPGRRILERTGRLKESIIGSTPDTVSERTATRLTYGTRVPYAVYHQKGTGRIPRRAFLDLTERQSAAIGAIVARYIRVESAKGFSGARTGAYVGA